MFAPVTIGDIRGGLLLILSAMIWLRLATRSTADRGSEMKIVFFLHYVLLCILLYSDKSDMQQPTVPPKQITIYLQYL